MTDRRMNKCSVFINEFIFNKIINRAGLILIVEVQRQMLAHQVVFGSPPWRFELCRNRIAVVDRVHNLRYGAIGILKTGVELPPDVSAGLDFAHALNR